MRSIGLFLWRIVTNTKTKLWAARRKVTTCLAVECPNARDWNNRLIWSKSPLGSQGPNRKPGREGTCLAE